MTIIYQIDRYAERIETQCIGDVTPEEVLEHFRELEAHPELPKRLDVFLDLERLTSIPNSDQIRDVSFEVDRLKATVEWGACAILATSDIVFGISRVFEVFTEGLFSRTRVFRDREEARRWLADPAQPA